MCDYGFKEFEQSWWQTLCVHDNNFEDYSRKQPSWCKPGLVYNISSGYRKVPGDMCRGGPIEMRNAPTPKACSIPSLENYIVYAKRKAIYRWVRHDCFTYTCWIYLDYVSIVIWSMRFLWMHTPHQISTQRNCNFLWIWFKVKYQSPNGPIN